MPNSGIGRRTNRCTRQRSFRFSPCCLVFVSQLASRRREWMVEEKKKEREREKCCTGIRSWKYINLCAQMKSIVVVLLFLCRYVGSFKYRAVAIENWRAFRRRYFSLRGITEGIVIYRDDFYWFLCLHIVSVIKDSGLQSYPEGVFFY